MNSCYRGYMLIENCEFACSKKSGKATLYHKYMVFVLKEM